MTANAAGGDTLESWAASLSFLRDDIARGVESMARRIDLVLPANAPPSPGSFEPNGYRGITRRGELAQIMVSEWAMLDSEPDEFFRRLTAGELSYLQRAFEEPKPPSQIALLLDAGPAQLGTPRLAHLAGLVVLERRARSMGVPLVVGVLGEAQAEWRSGALPELVELWIQARRSDHAGVDDLNRWLEAVPDEGSLWLFGAPHLEVAASDVDRLSVKRLSARESAWSAGGVTEIEVVVDGRSVFLDVPERSESVRLLRSRGLRRKERPRPTASAGTLRFPSFHGSVRRLLCRGDADNELISLMIPQSPERAAAPKKHQFAGQVLAASAIGPRIVALAANDDEVQVVTIGKKLGHIEKIAIFTGDLELSPADIDAICENGLEPLFFHAGSIVVSLAERWWMIDTTSNTFGMAHVAGAATPVSDQPRFVDRVDDDLFVEGKPLNVTIGTPVCLGPSSTVAVEDGPGRWRVISLYREPFTLDVDERSTVVGLTVIDNEPALLLRSPAGQMLRLITESTARTLTDLSANLATACLHPTLPLVALQRIDGSIDVVDLASSVVLTRIRTTP